MTAVVIGGGIVGLTAAHYLTERGRKVTLVEKCAVACHSSGKAGGFLTDGDSGWHGGSIARLAKHSFKLHEQLAAQLGPEAVGYRRVSCVGRGPGDTSSPEWLAPQEYERDMGDQRGLAQVTPYKFMEALHAMVRSRDCYELVIGGAVGVEVEDDKVIAVKVERDGATVSVPCSAVVIAMGPWTDEAAKWFPESAMPKDTVSNRYTSVIWDDTEVGTAATMVFTMGDDAHTEIYPRENECYANGCPTSAELPQNPLDIVPPAEEVDRVKAETFAAVARLKDAPVLRTTACFLAGSDDGIPVVGLVPKVRNAVVACGGGCWGILNGPAMGQAAAMLVMGEEPPVSIAPFDPARFGGVRIPHLPPQLSQKLQALASQDPQLAELLRDNPGALLQMLAMQQQEEQAQ